MQNIFKPSLYIRSWIWFLVIALAACSPSVPATVPPTIIPSPTMLPTSAHREALVQSVEVQISESNPPQVSALVHGNLTESCAALGESQVQYASNAFQITVYVNSRADIGCVQATTPFDITIPLDTKDLPAGSYTVTANGVSAAFSLPLADTSSGSINGWIWQDICTGGSQAPGPNCMQNGNNFYGDGQMQSGEPPIGGIRVLLGKGACPSTGLQETTTIATDLSYSFTGLGSGTYCVSIDPQLDSNGAILLPGTWTFPSLTDGIIGSTVTLASGENKFDVNFGWSYQNNPQNSQTCIDSAAFVADVTIPDNSVLNPNTAFTKTWRIKNTGTCTWDSSYLVTYISGTTMSQQPGYWILPPGQTVAPGGTVDINVGMTSPANNGNYVSYWGLKKENGQLMPVQGGVNYRLFYVKIKVNDGRAVRNVTAASIDIKPEQGSGPACTADSTYFVHASITTDAATSVAYEIDSSAGQTTAGFFQPSPMGPVSPSVTGTLNFEQADTKTIDLRFVGPYPYPDNITVLLWVNHSDWYQGKLSCDSN